MLESVDGHANAPGDRSRAFLALALLLPAPSLAVLCAMVWEPTRGTTLGQVLYLLAKGWILALPLIWRVWVERQPVSLSPMRHGGLRAGLLSGSAIALVILGGYWFIGRHIIDLNLLHEVAARNGLNRLARYLLLTSGLTFGNSLLEEYVWRWFVFRQCERLMGARLAVIISAAAFTLHHVIALRAQFPWSVTALASSGVFIGALAWSWLYQRYRSIWPCYLSHILADAAVFTVGGVLLFGM